MWKVKIDLKKCKLVLLTCYYTENINPQYKSDAFHSTHLSFVVHQFSMDSEYCWIFPERLFLTKIMINHPSCSFLLSFSSTKPNPFGSLLCQTPSHTCSLFPHILQIVHITKMVGYFNFLPPITMYNTIQ